MVCKPCRDGSHCGSPGEVTPRCTCQHHPSRTLTDPLAPLQPEPVRPDLPVPSVPSADAVPPFVTMLSDWAREHRSGRFTQAAVLRRKLVSYLDRMV